MKKNTVLYLLLVVLLLMNVFFLYNYLGRPNHKGPRENSEFIVKELGLNEIQLNQFKSLESKHHDNMRSINDDVKVYKDELFRSITASEINQQTIDSLIVLISKNEILREKELFNRLRGIYNLCNEDQKQSFSNIIKSARNNNGPRPEKPMRGELERPRH